MSYTFRLKFSGLCAFVPNKPIDDDPDYVDVLLVNANYDSDSDFGQTIGPLEPHTPNVWFTLRDLAGVREPQGDYQHHGAMWLLVGEQINIGFSKNGEPVPREKRLKIVHRSMKEKAPDSRLKEEDYFDWVAPMEKIHPQACDVDPRCLDLKPPPDLVIARIRLDDGVLKSDKIGKVNDKAVIAQFVPPLADEPCKQALTHRVVLELEVPDDVSVVLTTSEFGDSAVLRQATLGPPTQSAAQGAGEVKVLVSNLCCGYYLGEATDLPGPVEPPGSDGDFKAFYILAKDPVKAGTPLPIPVPVEYDTTGGQGGSEPIHCNVALFRPYPPVVREERP
ncbi:MAG TPA: hypothetical protein VHQ90_21145 [Thermoanaerobaculia bacterium]|nr:hypothetical protein [Thermoanaerobaculia bacterium]